MTIPEILKELEPYTGSFPMDAMRAAVEQRQAITPELLRVLERVAEDPLKWAERKDYMLHLFALHLLAQFREQRAYPLVVRIVSAPGETPFDLLGDTVTEGLGRILASVYDGNPSLLHSLIESEAVNEFVRGSALNTFLVLEHTGQMPRAEVVQYFRSLFHGRLPRTPSYAWDGLITEVTDLPAPELMDEVIQTYADELADPSVADLEWVQQHIAAPDPRYRDRHRLITDAIAEMEWWASFHPERDWPTQPIEPETIAPPSAVPDFVHSEYVAPTPFVREPKIGRNDPCPCGSGKKYKKCCGKA